MDEDRIAGSAQQAKGKAEAAAGRLTGETKLRVEGRADETAGTLRSTAGGIKDTSRGVADDPRSEVEQLRAKVKQLSTEPATPRLDAAAEAADHYGEQLDRALDVIRERPLAAVGAAAAVGFLLGRLMSGNSYVYRH
jgi:uncharacterized protein YjbJ (UPF0337 family)